MAGTWSRGGKNQLILYFGTRWRGGQLHAKVIRGQKSRHDNKQLYCSQQKKLQQEIQYLPQIKNKTFPPRK
jgi:hypothetical protein